LLLRQLQKPTSGVLKAATASALLIGFDESKKRSRDFIVLNVTSPHLVGHVGGHIPAPAFNGIEGDDANRLAVLAREQIADQGLAIGRIRIGLAPSSPIPRAEIVENDVGVLLGPVGRNRWRGTHNGSSEFPSADQKLVHGPAFRALVTLGGAVAEPWRDGPPPNNREM
jgi:hypothetical protein